jgi:hypothetical protein
MAPPPRAVQPNPLPGHARRSALAVDDVRRVRRDRPEGRSDVHGVPARGVRGQRGDKAGVSTTPGPAIESGAY